MHDIFLSYSRQDSDVMHRVMQNFIDAGLTVWTDEGIRPGTPSWKRAIDNAILEAKALVCISSPHAKQSKWVQAELDQAELYGKPIYIILARGNKASSISFGFASHQWIDIRDDNSYNQEIRKLIDTLKTDFDIAKLSHMPEPFKWCKIPFGNVILDTGGYVPNGGKSFEVSTFYIAQYPITNAQYQLFISDNGYNIREYWTNSGWKIVQTNKLSRPKLWDDNDYNGMDYPVVGVSWYEAYAFTQWASKKLEQYILLPTEQQWQRAAQGDDKRMYPWGNIFNEANANTAKSNIDKTTSVTQYPSGVSPYGVMDMSGNIWEWCSTIYPTGLENPEETDYRVLRGGSWYEVNTPVTHRLMFEPKSRGSHIGFRIVRNET